MTANVLSFENLKITKAEKELLLHAHFAMFKITLSYYIESWFVRKMLSCMLRLYFYLVFLLSAKEYLTVFHLWKQLESQKVVLLVCLKNLKS